jgi:hypothetical protein
MVIYKGNFNTVKAKGFFNTIAVEETRLTLRTFNKEAKTRFVAADIPKKIRSMIPLGTENYNVPGMKLESVREARRHLWKPCLEVCSAQDIARLSLTPNFSLKIMAEISGITTDELARIISTAWKSKPRGMDPSMLVTTSLDGGWFDYDLIHELTGMPMDTLKTTAVTHTLTKRR